MRLKLFTACAWACTAALHDARQIRHHPGIAKRAVVRVQHAEGLLLAHALPAVDGPVAPAQAPLLDVPPRILPPFTLRIGAEFAWSATGA